MHAAHAKELEPIQRDAEAVAFGESFLADEAGWTCVREARPATHCTAQCVTTAWALVAHTKVTRPWLRARAKGTYASGTARSRAATSMLSRSTPSGPRRGGSSARAAHCTPALPTGATPPQVAADVDAPLEYLLVLVNEVAPGRGGPSEHDSAMK